MTNSLLITSTVKHAYEKYIFNTDNIKSFPFGIPLRCIYFKTVWSILTVNLTQ